jgi:hypothetical protein
MTGTAVGLIALVVLVLVLALCTGMVTAWLTPSAACPVLVTVPTTMPRARTLPVAVETNLVGTKTPANLPAADVKFTGEESLPVAVWAAMPVRAAFFCLSETSPLASAEVEIVVIMRIARRPASRPMRG